MQAYFALRILMLVLILTANAFFASSEVALLTVRESRLRRLSAEGHLGAQAALNLLANPQRLLSVTQVGVTLATLGLGWAGEDTLYQLLQRVFQPLLNPATLGILHAISIALAFLVMTYAHVLLGEVVPKNVAVEKKDRLAEVVAPALLVFYRISEPFVFVIERSTAAVSKFLGLKGEQRGGGHSAEELKVMVSLSRGSGHLPEAQEEMIQRVLGLDSLNVREIMVPRNEIMSVSAEAMLEQALETMIREGHSRLPVYEDQPEKIIGILHYKDLLPIWQEQCAAIRKGRRPPEFRLRGAIRKPMVVPETKPLLQLLEEFRQGRSHMAMVVDEFGTIVGLVTVEDVLEQIVGEIHDEHEKELSAPLIEAPVVELDGATKILDLEAQYGIHIPSDAGFETLAGFILLRLGYIPKPGDAVEHTGRRFTVLEMDRNRIAKVRIEKSQPAA